MDWHWDRIRIGIVSYFDSFFRIPVARGLGLAIAFGAVWLACYRPPLFKKPWLWAVLISSALLTVAAVGCIQFPLLYWIDEALHIRYFVAAIPLALLSGLVQEGSKLVPVVVYWQRSSKNIDPKLGLAIGAVAGAGFGIFEAMRVFSSVPPWVGWGGVQFRFVALEGFWYIFFTVAAQTAFSALAGYGLARGRGWQFYLIASALHALLYYGRHSGLFTIIWLEQHYSLEVSIYTAVLAVLVTAWALWLRWRKTKTTADTTTSSS